MFVIPFPGIDPVLVQFGPLKIHWYGLAYGLGILWGWRYLVSLGAKYASHLASYIFHDFISWFVLGVLIGGRLGYVLFYEPYYYFNNPLQVFMVWRGGMSFHGGLIGVATALVLYCRLQKIVLLGFADLIATVTPIGIGLGRLANFINGELYGTFTDQPWGVIFPNVDNYPRHPTQIYEALTEGLLLSLLLRYLWKYYYFRNNYGRITGGFLLGYGLCRFLIEFLKHGEVFYSFAILTINQGQLLSIPLIVIGSYLLVRKVEL